MTPVYAAATNTYTCQCRTDLGYYQTPQNDECIGATSATVVQSRLINGFTVTYKDIVGSGGSTVSTTVQSDTFQDLLIGAASDCEFGWDSQACEALSNLCTLQLYDTTASACLYYTRIMTERAQLASDGTTTLPAVPALYYSAENIDPLTATSQIIDVKFAVSTSQGATTLPLVLAAFSLNGTFLGLQDVAAQFQNCATDPLDGMSSWLSIGHDYQSACSENLAMTLDTNPETVFYDMYIRDATSTLVPIPIRVENYRTGSRQPNLHASPLDYSSSVLFRRFFLIDVVSGIQDGSLQIIRVPSEIRIWIQQAASGQIYVPVMDILYTERQVSDLSLTDASQISSPTVTFSAVYFGSLVGFWKAVTVLFALVCVLGGLFALYRARAWSTRNLGPADGWDLEYLGRCALILAETLAPILFLLLVALAAYWFFAFKRQTQLKVLLPWFDADLKKFLAAHIVILAVHVLTKLHQQCTADIFLIDWEQSKGRLTYSGGDMKPRLAPVSVWRSIFLANEWDELQTYRQVNIEFSLLAMYFIFEALKVRWAATPQPDMHDLTRGPVHPVLLLGLECMVWICLAAVQLLFRIVFYDRYYKNKLLNFVDVLSMANLSILAFDELCHGYYIHGQSIHPCADTNIGELNAYLRREKADLVPRRGLHNTDEQCFEVYAQREMRSAFNTVYGVVIAEVEDQMAGSVAARLQRLSPEKQQRRFGGVDEARVHAYETVNHFLKSFFDQNLKEFQYLVRERRPIERMLGKTPDASHNTVLFHDETGFTALLLYGIEYHLLFFYVLVYSLASRSLDSTGGAALITWLLDVVVRCGRRHFGGKNLARKTMMDQKFLI
ncbi:Meckelin [Thoreauomyces humboldtii]|nr:Meckelin [Thoreauomyces humboldtii]